MNAANNAEALPLVDSHAHLDDAQFDADRDQMLQRAREAGVTAILAIGCNIHALDGPATLVAAHDWIYMASGVHPHEAKLATQSHYDMLNRLAAQPKCLAWGEIGLDYRSGRHPPLFFGDP
jgi:TatD DNase family protein